MKTNELKVLENCKLLVIVTGSIAAVKTPLLISNLIKLGAEIRCVASPSASNLVSPLSLGTLSRNRCYQEADQWDPIEPRPLHIDLAEWADLIVIAPLSASTLSRWVNGLAEGLIPSLLLASEKPVIAAPAMNTGMWSHQAVKRNWETLKSFPSVIALPPSEGLLACDRIGDGRMASPEIIQLAIESSFIRLKSNHSLKKDWQGCKLLVTAGPTLEDIDSARFLTNRSSGRMGVLMAQAAKLRGARVDFVHGPLQVSNNLLEGLNSYKIRSGEDMQRTLHQLQPQADAVAMSAAISDLRQKEGKQERKVNKASLIKSIENSFELVPDLLTELIKNRPCNQVILGFSALSGTDEEIKRIGANKKSKKGCDMLFANPIDRSNQGFDSDKNSGWLLGPHERVIELPLDSKLSIAHQLLDELIPLLKKDRKN